MAFGQSCWKALDEIQTYHKLLTWWKESLSITTFPGPIRSDFLPQLFLFVINLTPSELIIHIKETLAGFLDILGFLLLLNMS